MFSLFFAIIIILWIIWNPIWDEVMYQFISTLGYPLSIIWISAPEVNFFNFFNFFLFIVALGLLYEFYKPSLNFEWDKNKRWKAAGIFLIAIVIIVVISIMFIFCKANVLAILATHPGESMKTGWVTSIMPTLSLILIASKRPSPCNLFTVPLVFSREVKTVMDIFPVQTP